MQEVSPCSHNAHLAPFPPHAHTLQAEPAQHDVGHAVASAEASSGGMASH